MKKTNFQRKVSDKEFTDHIMKISQYVRQESQISDETSTDPNFGEKSSYKNLKGRASSYQRGSFLDEKSPTGTKGLGITFDGFGKTQKFAQQDFKEFETTFQAKSIGNSQMTRSRFPRMRTRTESVKKSETGNSVIAPSQTGTNFWGKKDNIQEENRAKQGGSSRNVGKSLLAVKKTLTMGLVFMAHGNGQRKRKTASSTKDKMRRLFTRTNVNDMYRQDESRSRTEQSVQLDGKSKFAPEKSKLTPDKSKFMPERAGPNDRPQTPMSRPDSVFRTLMGDESLMSTVNRRKPG